MIIAVTLLLPARAANALLFLGVNMCFAILAPFTFPEHPYFRGDAVEGQQHARAVQGQLLFLSLPTRQNSSCLHLVL
jgi:hypothetical protein